MIENKNQHNEIQQDTPKRPWWERILALIIIIVLLAAGIRVAKHFLKTKPVAKKKQVQKKQETVVEVKPVTLTDTTVLLMARGIVIPATQVNLQPQVSGTVTDISPQLIPGGIVKEGETVVTIDDRDYHLKLILKQAALTKAQGNLSLEAGQQKVAKKEWNSLKKYSLIPVDPKTATLALRNPQLKSAQAAVKAAEADVAQAQINIERTRINSPFNAIVHEKMVDKGSQASPQNTIATLIGTDTFWIKLSISTSQLVWFTLPSKIHSGSPITIIAGTHTTKETHYPGKIITLMSSVEPEGVMAQLIVEVTDPLGLKNKKQPLLLGSLIRAKIKGKKITKVFSIPPYAIHDKGTVFIADSNDTLEIRQVTIIFKDRTSVYVKDGLKEGDRLIVSPIAAPVSGMPLLIEKKDEKTSDKPSWRGSTPE